MRNIESLITRPTTFHKYYPRKKEFEAYGRKGMTMKMIAKETKLTLREIQTIYKALNISIIKLRNE